MDLNVTSRTLRASSGAAAPAYHVALGHLRAFVIFLVVVHHSLLAYYPGLPSPAQPFAGGAMLWRAFPVLDPVRWALTPLLTSFNDIFFMALMFLLSGLFVPGSLERKGLGRFLRGRVVRLGIPFLFSAGIVTPIAYYAAYLQVGGTPGLESYWQAWRSIGGWPVGPAWFMLLLLVYDGMAAILFLLLPRWASWIASLAKGARERPARLFWVVAGLSFAAYAPLAIAYGPDTWTSLGVLQFQTSRVLHYFVYFAVGIGVGTLGLRGGPLATDGALGHRWRHWALAMVGAYVVAVGAYLVALCTKGPVATLLTDLGVLTFALSCAASCFGFLAIFTRFARRPSAAWRSASDDSYGIYVVHYAIVAWCQYALLRATLPAPAKAILVITVAYGLSWATAALLRRIPLVARVV